MLEVLGTFAKLAGVALDNNELSLIGANPVFITLRQTFQVVQAHGLLILAATLLNLCYQRRNARTDINHQVGQLHQRHHQVEEVGIVGKVTVRHHTLTMQVGREDASILEDGAVLNDGVCRLRNLYHLLETLVKEIHLQVE